MDFKKWVKSIQTEGLHMLRNNIIPEGPLKSIVKQDTAKKTVFFNFGNIYSEGNFGSR